MNPLSIIESWIFSEMLSDATLTGIIGNRIYMGIADEEAGDLYVVINYVDAEAFYNLGTKRDHAWGYYDIVAWQLGKDLRNMKLAADRIDTMFSGFRNRSFTRAGETWKFYSRVTRPISRVDDTEPPLRWRGLGGTYKISATKT